MTPERLERARELCGETMDYLREHDELIDMASEHPQLLFSIGLMCAAMALSVNHTAGNEKLYDALPRMMRDAVAWIEREGEQAH